MRIAGGQAIVQLEAALTALKATWAIWGSHPASWQLRNGIKTIEMDIERREPVAELAVFEIHFARLFE